MTINISCIVQKRIIPGCAGIGTCGQLEGEISPIVVIFAKKHAKRGNFLTQ
jgi:hypothetical protein